MDLKYALNQIQTNTSDLTGYLVYVVNDYEKVIHDLPFEEYQVFDIDIEDEDSEITLITNEGSKLSENNQPLSAKELIKKLNGLMPKYKNYILFSGSSLIDLGEDHCGRLDKPLIAMGFNHEDKKIAFVQEGKKNA